MGGVCETILHNIRINFKTLLGDLGLIPGVGRAPGGEYGYPLQYSGLENFMDRGAWRATVHGVSKSWAQLSYLHFQTEFNLSCILFKELWVRGSAEFE